MCLIIVCCEEDFIMSLRQKWAALAGVAGLALVLGACSSNSSSSKKTFTMPTDSELSTIDLSKSTALGTFDTLNNTNEGLYRLGKNSKPETGLATKMTQSKDGKRYIIDMRHNTKWSNGDTVTAQDFVYSWKRTVNPKTRLSIATCLAVSRMRMLLLMAKNQRIRLASKRWASINFRSISNSKFLTLSCYSGSLFSTRKTKRWLTSTAVLRDTQR